MTNTTKETKGTNPESVDKPQDDIHQLSEAGRSKIAGIDAEKERKRKARKLCTALDYLYRAMGGGFVRAGEQKIGGDASSLFTLVSIDSKPILVKVGWGEFSRETFTKGRYPTFQKAPIDLYCVSQSGSYFAEGEKAEQMRDNPAEYLKENALFHARAGEFTMAKKIDHRHHTLEHRPEAIPYDEMLSTARNTLIERYSSPEAFAKFLKMLPEYKKELGSFISKYHHMKWLNQSELEKTSDSDRQEQEIKALVNMLINMGVEMIGIAVGDKKAMESVLELKSQFDFETNSF